MISQLLFLQSLPFFEFDRRMAHVEILTTEYSTSSSFGI